MYSTLIILLLCSPAFGFNILALFNRFYKIVIFGDSYSDTGNVYRLTSYTWPIVPPYYQGRFCNGPNWVDNLNVLVTNDFAYGSATTDNNFVQGLTKLNTIAVPGVRQQVAQYLATTPNFFFNLNLILPLHVIWAGGNDFLFNNTLTPVQIVNSLSNSMKDLLNAGVKNLLVFNQAPIQALPNFNVYHQNAYFASLTQMANDAINTTLRSLQQNYKSACIYMFDLNALITDIVSTNSSTFTNSVDQCWANYNVTTVIQNCSDPTQYVFLDGIHFSSTVQKKIADAIQPILSWSFNKYSPGRYIIPY